MPVDVSKIPCGICKGPITTQEYASYGERCENCYCGKKPVTTMGQPAALRNGVNPVYGKGKYANRTSKNKHEQG